MASYPNAIDAPDTAMQGTTLFTNDDHSLQHRTIGSAVISIENKLGVGSGSANTNLILVGTANGTTSWQQTWNNGTLGTPTVTGGIINNATLGTPAITGGTANSQVIGTPTISSPTINLGSDATGDMLYRNSGGSESRLAIGAANKIITTNGTIPSWSTFPLSFSNTGQIGDFTSTSSTPTNITSGSLIINPVGAAGTVQVNAAGIIFDSSGTGASLTLQVNVNGTTVHAYSIDMFASSKAINWSLNGQKVIGTVGTVQLQLTVGNNSDSVTVRAANLSAMCLG